MIARFALVTMALGTFPAGVWAETWCVPYGTSASILGSPDPSDIHPDWQDGSTVGLAWSLLVLDWSEDEEFSFLEGELYGPDGGLVNDAVVVLKEEWDCAEG